MIFRQLFDAESWTYTYLLADPETREAALIDSVDEQAERDARILEQLNLKLKYLLETHVHADHITGVNSLKQRFPKAQSVVSQAGGVECADHHAQEGDIFQLGAHQIQVLATPGHTDSCLSYLCKNRLFTGDTLLIRGCGRTDFQQGDAGRLYDSVQKLFALPDDTQVYPAHNYVGETVSSIGEEKQFNPRLAHKSRDEFIAIMQALNLPQPKKIMESVPANLQCGKRNNAEAVNQGG